MAEHPILPHQALLPVLIIGMWLVLVLPGLGLRPTPMFDESFHARSGVELAVGLPPSEVSHPPLVKDVTAVALLATGNTFDPRPLSWHDFRIDDVYPAAAVWWWRFPAVLAGAAALGVVGLLARAVLGPGPAPALAMALLALDGCFFVHARIAMTNIWELLFVAIAALAAWRAAGDEPGPDWWLALSGAACGAAIASRWSALAPWLLIAGWTAWRLRRRPERWLPLAAGFSVAPALVYTAAYLPLVAIGPAPGAWDLLTLQGWRTGFVDAQLRIYEFHAYLNERHAYQSPWWSWPLMLKPTWYALQHGAETARAVWAIGNAAIWWGSLPALLAAAHAGRKQPGLAFVALMGLGPWLAWGLQPRSMTFMHYFLAAIPYACIAQAAIIQAWWRARSLAGGPAPLEPLAARAACVAFGAAAVAWLAFYYPVLAYTELQKPQIMQRVWFKEAWL